MALNNQVILTGRLGKDPSTHEGKKDNHLFMAFSMATQDSYKDKDEEWHQKEAIWHNVLIFNPKLFEVVKSLKKGHRVEVTGSISYQQFSARIKGKTVKKKDASIVGHAVEHKPLPQSAGDHPAPTQ